MSPDLTTPIGVLAELVALEAMKDQAEEAASRGLFDSASPAWADYQRRKPIAWAAAREVVALKA